jgi:hypothetical protein
MISLDYTTGRLYSGFTDIYFLKGDAPERYKPRIQKELALRATNYKIKFIQNAAGEPYVNGDTVLVLVTTLSSEDIKAIIRREYQLNEE